MVYGMTSGGMIDIPLFDKEKAVATFIVSFDLMKPGQDYPAVTKVLNEIRGVRILRSTWLVPSYEYATAIRSKLLAVMDGNDKVFVGRLAFGGDINVDWPGITREDTLWLEQHH